VSPQRQRPRFQYTGFRVAAVVQVHAAKGSSALNVKAHTVGLVVAEPQQGVSERPPGFRVRVAGPRVGEGVVGNLGPLLFAPLVLGALPAPGHPLLPFAQYQGIASAFTGAGAGFRCPGEWFPCGPLVRTRLLVVVVIPGTSPCSKGRQIPSRSNSSAARSGRTLPPSKRARGWGRFLCLSLLGVDEPGDGLGGGEVSPASLAASNLTDVRPGMRTPFWIQRTRQEAVTGRPWRNEGSVWRPGSGAGRALGDLWATSFWGADRIRLPVSVRKIAVSLPVRHGVISQAAQWGTSRNEMARAPMRRNAGYCVDAELLA